MSARTRDAVLCTLSFAANASIVTAFAGWTGLAWFTVGVTSVVVVRAAWVVLR